jgi:hypothetical protein
MWESENQDESPLMTTDNFHGIDRLVPVLPVPICGMALRTQAANHNNSPAASA